MERTFDPDGAAAPGSGLFGLPHGRDDALVHVLPVPFHATTSYRRGAAHGPAAVVAASRQVELDDALVGRAWERGIWLAPVDPRVVAWNDEASAAAERVIAAGGEVGGDAELAAALERVNAIGALVNESVEAWTDAALEDGRVPVVLGGDHSTPFGAIAACARRHAGMGLLHVDAHADMRVAFEGFTWSHASILHNVLERIDGIAKVVQVGLRDVGEAEREAIERSRGRVRAIFDEEWARWRLAGEELRPRVRAAIDALPGAVWITFDVDGLDPALCPNTGTPVPGGLSWHDAGLWIEELVRSGRRVLGCDLNEVSPGPEGDPRGEGWDAIVGARLLYRLIGAAVGSLRQ